MGRKCRLTRELIADVEKFLRAGNYATTVMAALNISNGTWYRWLKEGEKATSGIKREFWEAVKKADAHAEIMAVAGILKAGRDPKHWTALAWFLERKFRERWGKNIPVDAGDEDDLKALVAALRGETDDADPG